MSEWFKEHAWKACVGLKLTEGSNPFPSTKPFSVSWKAFLLEKTAEFYFRNFSAKKRYIIREVNGVWLCVGPNSLFSNFLLILQELKPI